MITIIFLKWFARITQSLSSHVNHSFRDWDSFTSAHVMQLRQVTSTISYELINISCIYFKSKRHHWIISDIRPE